MSELSQLMTYLKVNLPNKPVVYGYSQEKQTPYYYVTDFKLVNTYQTGRLAFKTITFTLAAVSDDLDEADDMADTADALLDTTSPIPKAMTGFQEGRQAVADEGYKQHVLLNYKLDVNA